MVRESVSMMGKRVDGEGDGERKRVYSERKRISIRESVSIVRESVD
jgi:hypothetical protein